MKDWPEVKAVYAERDRLRAAVDAVESLCVAQGADSYVMVYALRRALATVADPDPHTTSDEETT
jgi:hypothetical protein